MSKKGLFEKLGLVESEEEFNMDEVSTYLSEHKVDVPEDLAVDETLSIEDIYNKFGLSDVSKSIFKVNEFNDVLPKELSTDSRRASVLGILNASGLNVELLVSDATSRIEALNTTKTAFSDETTSIINKCQEQIAELEKQIDQFKDTMNNRKISQETQDEIIKAEVDKVEKIINFINPTN